MKGLLIDQLGADISFAYPKDRKKSQVIIPKWIKPDIVNPVVLCAEKIRQECKFYNFKLDESYRSNNDCKLSMECFKNNRPSPWNTFCRTMFKGFKQSSRPDTGCDLVFQIFYNLLYRGYRKTPLQVLIAQTIHDISRSKLAVTIFNQLYI